MDSTLAPFIRFLEHHNLITFDIDGEGEEQFINRFKIQKYVFLAKKFGMPFTYDHNIYLYGPYSSTLSKDYYKLSRNGDVKNNNTILHPDFNQNDFLIATQNNTDWLEIATTLIDRNKTTPDRPVLLDKVYAIKPQFDIEFISSILDDLVKRNLVNLS